MSLLPTLGIVALLAALLLLMERPAPLLYRLIRNTLGGYACLVLLNLLLGEPAFSLNIVSAVTAGFLGLPGIGLLLLLRLVLF